MYDRVKGKDPVTKMQYVDMHLWLVHDILMKGDKMGMANSLEVRVPFLDKKVLELAVNCRWTATRAEDEGGASGSCGARDPKQNGGKEKAGISDSDPCMASGGKVLSDREKNVHIGGGEAIL